MEDDRKRMEAGLGISSPYGAEDGGQIFMAWCKDTGEAPTRENAKRISDVLDHGCTEDQFVLRGQRLGVNTAMAIAQVLDKSNVVKLDLYTNIIRDNGCQALSQLLRDSKTLTHLNLGGN
eukprot:408593_1